MIEVTIPLRSNDEAVLVLGPYDRHAKLLRQALAIEIFVRGTNLRLKGPEEKVEVAQQRIEHLLGKFRKGRELQSTEIEQILLGPSSSNKDAAWAPQAKDKDDGGGRIQRGRMESAHPMIHARVRAVEPRGQNQRAYLDLIEKEPLTFGLGAAGTGKTFLAVAGALRALRRGEVRRMIITRPVVEAGENLGFLPGDLQAKLDPYMRPIYDALGELLQFEDVTGLIEAGVIEIAPLAYMRGRTLSNAFVILDEAQNATAMQMKMFLTRLGEDSRMVVTGDPTQNDLDRGRSSGLMDAVGRLRGFEGVGLVEFSPKDIVRHPLVASIVRAYERPFPKDGGGDSGDSSRDASS